MEELCVEGDTILKFILQEIGCKGVDWIDMAQDRDKRQDSINMEVNFWVPYNMGTSPCS